MRIIKIWALIGIVMMGLISCGDEAIEQTNTNTNTNTNTTINKIMALGASRVEGDRPQHESFRYETWKNLIENNWTFDFIGTQNDPGSYPVVESLNFDPNHQGRGGLTSGDILDQLENDLDQTGGPDIVLFSSPGGNDGLQNLPYDEAISNINQIIDVLQEVNPNVTLIIEQMAPGRSNIMTEELLYYFNQLQDEILTIVENKSTATSQVIAVDMYSGFTDAMLADDVHYNTKGAMFIAQRYYEVLTQVLEQE
jgi:lysophospholipase L1-like esterase